MATKGQTVTVYNQNAQIIPIKGIESYECRDNHIIISNIHNKKGLLDYDGTQSIPFKYDTLYTSRSISVIDFIARKGDTYGYISRKDEIIKPFTYKHIYGLKDDLVFVNADGKAGMYDKEGNIKLAFEYDSICDTHYNNFEPEENKYIVIKMGRWVRLIFTIRSLYQLYTMNYPDGWNMVLRHILQKRWQIWIDILRGTNYYPFGIRICRFTGSRHYCCSQKWKVWGFIMEKQRNTTLYI